MSNDAQTIKINEVLNNTRSTIHDFILAADEYCEYECDDSIYTLYLADTKRKIEKLAALGLPTDTKLNKMHGAAILSYENWHLLNRERIDSIFDVAGKVNWVGE